ncbi:MAG: PAS domain-containing sensor histidine kinase [Saprospiraceae bacterium]
MQRRQYITLGLTVFFFAAALIFDNFVQNSTNLANYKLQIENYLHEQEAEASNLFANNDFIQYQFQQSLLLADSTADETEAVLSDSDQQYINELERLALKPYTVLFHENDSLVLWNNNKVDLELEQLTQIRNYQSKPHFVALNNGFYEVLQRNYSASDSVMQTVTITIPIKYNYILQSDYLQNEFVQNKNIPQSVTLTSPTNSTDYSITRNDGSILCYLKAPPNIKDKSQQLTLLVLYLIGFFCIGMLVNDISKIISQKTRLWVGAAFLIAMVFVTRFLTIKFDVTSTFSDLHLFARTFETPVLNSSLGDLLINIILLLWMMVFFYREFTVNRIVNMGKPWRYGLAVLNFFSIILGLVMVTGVFKSLVIESGITFNFDNVFKMTTYSVLALIGVLLLLFALFLFTHRMMLAIQKLELTFPQRVTGFLFAMLLALPLLSAKELYFPPSIFALSAFLYYITFDLFTFASKQKNVWWGVWLVVFAVYATALLRVYNNKKDIETQTAYAKELAIWQDSFAEEGIAQLRHYLKQDSALYGIAKAPLQFDFNKKGFDRIVDNYYTRDNYLFNNYNYKYYYYDVNSELSIIDKQPEKVVIDNLREARADSLIKPTRYENLEFIIDEEENELAYVLPINLVDNGYDDRVLLMEFKRKRREPSKVYTELLLDFQYKNLANLNIYDYAIYRRKELVDYNNRAYDIKLDENKVPPIGTTINYPSHQRSEIVYHDPNGTVVMIGKELGGIIKIGSLFSYLFILLIVALLVLILINSVTNALPNATKFKFTRPSLRNTIQLSTFTLIVGSFLGIALVTVYYFKTSSETYHENRLERKLRSVLTHAGAELSNRNQDTLQLSEIPKMLEAFSEIHRMDLNIYRPDGSLLKSSEDDIFKKGIIASKMNPLALHGLAVQKQGKVVFEESVGDLSYKAAYVPLQNPPGNTLAYVGLPYYSKQRKLNSDVSDFMGTLLNVYVLIFVIAGMLATGIASRITLPIAKIGERMRNFELESNTEKLEYEHQDEIGQLVGQFNQMIDKTVESAKKLADTERDLAWREMAKQVAHEIKNPMTPMRLQIEFFKMKYKQDPDAAINSFNRMTDSLIEQIDTLTNIATEFSNFAKMPRAKNETINLNDLIHKVHQIFSQEERPDFRVSLNIPDEQFQVFADREQLQRVFNNLIKNAIQAIPDGRFGTIDIDVSTKDENVVIQVQDNGSGIPKNMHEKVFLFNFTTKSSGTGLGLAMSKNIIEQAEGKIYFETEDNIGTSFFVELPIQEIIAEHSSDNEGITPIVLPQS